MPSATLATRPHGFTRTCHPLSRRRRNRSVFGRFQINCENDDEDDGENDYDHRSPHSLRAFWTAAL
jgi:hypothetical protein